MIFLSFFITITLLIYELFVIRSEKKERVQKRLAAFVTAEKDSVTELIAKNQTTTIFERFIKPLFEDFKRSFKKRMPGEKEARIEKKLQLAGNPFGMNPVDFRLLQAALFFTFPFLFGGYASLLRAGTGGIIIFIMIGILMGLTIPHLYLRQKTKARNHKALRELPDVLDLLTVSLEAGLGFDSAVSRVVSKKEGVISNEFHRCLEEIRLGKTRREALAGIRERVDVDEVKAFISSILQAEKLGIGMVQVLRVQSNEVRDRRKQRAEEEAMKAPIKMLFPLVLFIFPSLFIVLLGPAIIQFVQTFQK
ncbi:MULTISPECIES: type II secretion system F family protein [unclassified Bacillus (in: firmicutes)]|uniref:type II secretion system F family protein n=1 Tax=unclassified Bacillus (in: firmicutes) TaxID=185979 RepID=UPI0008ECA699|nr:MULTISPECIES: type II secretion system F family protein [unclassified Bacillus (in: firmicutes)]SFA79295.1 tight adherence protein C [Bacillus sp. UNCCL13]SFQ69285.1 tight adherence protein C [Bacillus sp. cl95]